MRKLRIALAVVGIVVVLILAIAYFVDFDAPGLGQRILEAAGEDAGIELKATGFRFNVFAGIELEGVVANTPVPAGMVRTTADSVTLEHRLWPLLRGDIVIDRLVISRPVIDFINLVDARAGTAHVRSGAPRRVAAQRPASPGGEGAARAVAGRVVRVGRGTGGPPVPAGRAERDGPRGSDRRCHPADSRGR